MTDFQTQLEPSDIVIFGGTGDLALRKIIPALYHRLNEGQLPGTSRTILIGRQEMSRDKHLAAIKASSQTYLGREFDEAKWRNLAAQITYIAADAKKPDSYGALQAFLNKDPRPVRIFYLAVGAELFGTICTTLHHCGMVTPTSRVVLEKPIGRDIASFRATNQAVLEYFREDQIYRIDHYLGKETVQNLMVLRFGNHMFERIWNGDVIDHVQISVAEEIGVGERYGYYDNYGAMRDMVQNHLLQLLCLVAMDSPPQMSAAAVRDEKLKVLRSLRPITGEAVRTHTVRGQYREGALRGKPVMSYQQDIGNKASDTETFVAIKTHVDNWRWSGTPFYLRTGKRLNERFSEIVIQFKPVPHNIFPQNQAFPETNKLIVRLQPDEFVNLEVNTKVPGPGGYRLKPVHLKLSLGEEFNERVPDAYERLLMDVVRGNPTLFMRSDEVEAAWEWSEHILNGWRELGMRSQPYVAGSHGPDDAIGLLARDDRRWYQP